MSKRCRTPTDDDCQMLITQDALYPVCTPDLAAQIAGPEDLDRFPCLTDKSGSKDWVIGAKAAGVSLHNIGQGAGDFLYSLALEEAKAGVLMGHDCLLQEVLQTGVWVRLFDISCPTDQPLVQEAPNRPGVDDTLVEIVTLLAL